MVLVPAFCVSPRRPPNPIYQQAVEGNGIKFPDKTAALLCGMKEMTQLTTGILVEKGVDPSRILLNF